MSATPFSTGTTNACSLEIESSARTTEHFAGSRPMVSPAFVTWKRLPVSGPPLTIREPYDWSTAPGPRVILGGGSNLVAPRLAPAPGTPAATLDACAVIL